MAMLEHQSLLLPKFVDRVFTATPHILLPDTHMSSRHRRLLDLMLHLRGVALALAKYHSYRRQFQRYLSRPPIRQLHHIPTRTALPTRASQWLIGL